MSQEEIYPIYMCVIYIHIYKSRDECIMVRRFSTKEKGNFYFFKDFVVFVVLGCYFCINFLK